MNSWSRLQKSILLALLAAKRKTGSPMLKAGDLERELGLRVHQFQGDCEELAHAKLAVCTPIDGPLEIMALTVAGVRAAQHLFEQRMGGPLTGGSRP